MANRSPGEQGSFIAWSLVLNETVWIESNQDANYGLTPAWASVGNAARFGQTPLPSLLPIARRPTSIGPRVSGQSEGSRPTVRQPPLSLPSGSRPSEILDCRLARRKGYNSARDRPNQRLHLQNHKRRGFPIDPARRQVSPSKSICMNLNQVPHWSVITP